MTGKYLCPNCEAELNLKTRFTGWDLEAIDSVTGEPIEALDESREDIHVRTYFCDNGCGWKEDADAFDQRIEDEEEVEEDFPPIEFYPPR